MNDHEVCAVVTRREFDAPNYNLPTEGKWIPVDWCLQPREAHQPDDNRFKPPFLRHPYGGPGGSEVAIRCPQCLPEDNILADPTCPECNGIGYVSAPCCNQPERFHYGGDRTREPTLAPHFYDPGGAPLVSKMVI